MSFWSQIRIKGTITVSGNFDFVFAVTGFIVVLSKLFVANNILSTYNFQDATLVNSVFNKDSKYNLEYEILQKDKFGNPLEVRNKKGMVSSFVWGAHGRWLLANIENANYSSIVSAVGGQNIVNKLLGY